MFYYYILVTYYYVLLLLTTYLLTQCYYIFIVMLTLLPADSMCTPFLVLSCTRFLGARTSWSARPGPARISALARGGDRADTASSGRSASVTRTSADVDVARMALRVHPLTYARVSAPSPGGGGSLRVSVNRFQRDWIQVRSSVDVQVSARGRHFQRDRISIFGRKRFWGLASASVKRTSARERQKD